MGGRRVGGRRGGGTGRWELYEGRMSWVREGMSVVDPYVVMCNHFYVTQSEP